MDKHTHIYNDNSVCSNHHHHHDGNHYERRWWSSYDELKSAMAKNGNCTMDIWTSVKQIDQTTNNNNNTSQ